MNDNPWIVGKAGVKLLPPAVILLNPKDGHNVGAAVRSASCFGLAHVVFTGDRLEIGDGRRLPREERMKGYRKVGLRQYDYPFDLFPGAPFVCVELVEGAVPLPYFEHPAGAVYVFGPEDGDVPQAQRKLCSHFVKIPSAHCLNLSTAVAVVLAHRVMSRHLTLGEPLPELDEQRGFIETEFAL